MPSALAAATSGVRLTVMFEDHDISAMDQGRRDPGGAPVKLGMDTGMATRRREDDRLLMGGVQTLADMVTVLGPRQAAVARELTKLFEVEIARWGPVVRDSGLRRG